jgi:uncharacterized membrane protein/mono/diheme cytochrome c family protein
MERNQNPVLESMKRLLPCLLLAAQALSAGAAETAAAAAKVQKIFEWSPFLAPFHAVVLHFPIGFITVAFIIEIWQMRRPNREMRRVTVLMMWLAAITGVISAVFGWMRAGTGGYQVETLQMHKALGISVPVLTVLTLFLLRMASRNDARPLWIRSSRLVLAGTMILTGITGHYGGVLTHGANYLTENAPGFVRELLEDHPSPGSAATVAAVNDQQRSFIENVQPIFAAKCHSCHGAEKHKGGYRIDLPESILKGGESGKAAIKPGNPFESQLVRLILLPADHDDVMPPAGKQPLTVGEIAIILDWIRNGAAMPGTSPPGNAPDAKGG